MTKIAGTVILYYPERNTIFNILSYAGNIDKLYIIDNSEKNNQQLIDEIGLDAHAYTYIHDGVNQGIALRLNQAARLAIAEGYEWLLTMDQDSAFDKQGINSYLQCLSAHTNLAITSMFGITFLNKPAEQTGCNSTPVNKLITSGSIINLQLFESVGGFDEKLFIDEVDFEYCYRSITKGYSIVQFNHIFLQHSIGITSRHTSFKSLKASPRSLHAPIRLYYRTRNYFYINKKYRQQFPQDITATKRAVLNSIKNNILYGSKRLQVLKFIITGFFDYKKGKMGKYKH
jgi:rhamnosyltransferase